ncbi:MAG: hypothetical protein KC502_08535 [Myxococcales bacterium]|nr:hypothetical protein [Myxococcales bacterium]
MSSFNARPHLAPDALSRLGLDHARLGRGVRLSPKEQRRRARRRSSRTRQAWEPGFGAGLYEEATRPAVDLGGFHLRACRSGEREVYRLTCDTAELVVEVSGGIAPWTRDPNDGRILYIEPGADVVYRISRPDGTGVVVVNEEGKGVYAYAFRPKTGMVDVRRISSPTCPAPNWLTGHDADWLRELVTTRAARKGTFSATVAVGVWMRLHSPAPEQRVAALDALLSGRIHEETSAPLSWFESLDPGHRGAALSGALSHTGALSEHLAMLRTTLDLERPDWSDRLRSVLHIRDDLEGVRSLLLHTGEVALLDEQLALFDAEGRRFLLSLPRPAGLWDARLRRVAQVDPSAWWADPARSRRRAAHSG